MKFTLTQSLIATVGMGNAIRNFLKCNVRVVYIFCCLLDNKNIKTNKEEMLHADISCETVPDGASLTLWLVQGDVSKSFDVTNLSDPLEYSLSEFENGKIHVRLQINGVEDTISEIYVK